MLKLRNLNKRFENKEILSDFSYEFNTGIYIIRGKSGIGKTTLLRLIAGLDKDFEGHIEGGGVKNVSFVFQEYRLFAELNALENALVTFDVPSEDDIEYAKSLLRSIGISDTDMNLYPDELSGGMKLRISIARAVLKNCDILLLDEPTRELDPASVKMVIDLILTCGKRQTVIIVTHDELEALEGVAKELYLA